MIIFSFIGVLIIFAILWDGFETIILPRRVTRRFRLTRIFYRSLWKLWRKRANHFTSPAAKENYLGFFGPLSLMLLLVLWAALLIFGFALVYFGLPVILHVTEGDSDFWAYLYASGGTFFPVGLIDVYPSEPLGRFLFITEAGTGFGFLASVIGYLPVLYQGFSKREVSINLLDSQAGSPPNALHLLEQFSGRDIGRELPPQLEQWETWCAELLEAHLSYPVLAYYRSQHDSQSWVAALLVILDVSALVLASKHSDLSRSAKATFAIARHAAIDLTQTFPVLSRTPNQDRLPKKDLKAIRLALQRSGLSLADSDESEEKLKTLRALYEPYTHALSAYFLMPVTPILSQKGVDEVWRTTLTEIAEGKVT